MLCYEVQAHASASTIRESHSPLYRDTREWTKTLPAYDHVPFRSLGSRQADSECMSLLSGALPFVAIQLNALQVDSTLVF